MKYIALLLSVLFLSFSSNGQCENKKPQRNLVDNDRGYDDDGYRHDDDDDRHRDDDDRRRDDDDRRHDDDDDHWYNW